MSSRREVLIRILALLQRKTLIETKNRTLKWHYWTVRSIKNVALLTEDGAFALFFRPHPRELAIHGKKNANSRGSARGGGGLGAGGIDWYISSFYNTWAGKSKDACLCSRVAERFCGKGVYPWWYSDKQNKTKKKNKEGVRAIRPVKYKNYVAGKYTRARATLAGKYTNQIFKSKDGTTSIKIVN